MNILEIPFNQFLGLRDAQDASEYLLELPESPQMHNHLRTVHASAQFALAEATSGKCLVQTFADLSEIVIPVVRRVEVKYSHPARGILRSKAFIPQETVAKIREELLRKKRILIPVRVEIVDADERLTMSATFDWFIQIGDSAER